MRRIEGLMVWLGLHKTEEKRKEYKRNKGGKPFYGKVCSSDRKSAGIIVFQARSGGKDPHFLWKWAVVEATLLDKNFLLVRK